MKWNRILALGMGTALCLSLMAGCGSGGDISSSDTQEDGCVTIRDRDTMEQIRIPVDQVREYIEQRLIF